MFEERLWKESFFTWPTWPCPSCGQIVLALSQNKSDLVVEELGRSKRAHDHEDWDPEWIEKRFIAIFKCRNPICGEVVSVCGSVSVSESHYQDEDGEWHRNYEDEFRPHYFTDAPPIFQVPETCPDVVVNQLKAAFALIWCDTAAASNRLRAAVEALLDVQGVQKTTISKKRKREYLSTHSRIDKLKSKNGEAGDLLMAIKWIGNRGTHSRQETVQRVDFLKAVSLFEAAIERLYINNAQKLARLAADINKRKGKPIRPRKKRKRR